MPQRIRHKALASPQALCYIITGILEICALNLILEAFVYSYHEHKLTHNHGSVAARRIARERGHLVRKECGQDVRAPGSYLHNKQHESPIGKGNVGSTIMGKAELSTTQKAAVERIKILMNEYALVKRPSFLYTQKELLRNMKADLSMLDEEYIKKHKIPDCVVKKMAGEVYDALMEKSEYDRAITVAEHYKL